MSFSGLICLFFGHAWGKWEYVTPGSCRQTHNCTRCKNVETTRTKHQWGEWEDIPDQPCHQQRVCARDGVHAAREKAHVWVYDDQKGVRCSECDKRREFPPYVE